MPKVYIKSNLPEESEELRLAQDGLTRDCGLFDIDKHLLEQGRSRFIADISTEEFIAALRELFKELEP